MTQLTPDCDQEPIHALGLIQGHGAFLAFDRSGCAVARSENAALLLGSVPELSAMFTDAHFDAPARDSITRALNNPTAIIEPVECSGADGAAFDLVLHWSGDLLFVEWEGRPLNAAPNTHYATLVQQGIQELQRSAALSVQELLQASTSIVRTLTGFDRVMAYRFLPDNSGDVIAESLREGLSPYLHLRYPAGDIPAQARRLYVLNPIRQIGDVYAAAVPIKRAAGPDAHEPLDLSHSILRSVSPIHVQYLKNMQVAASMSISIVVDGKLWGLIACHHETPLAVSHAIRVSCTVITQVLAIMVERTELLQRVLIEGRIERLRGHIADALASAEDATAGLLAANESMQALIPSNGLSIVVGQRVGSFPDHLDRMAAIKVADFLSDNQLDTLITDSVSRDVPVLNDLHAESDRAAGILAIQMSGENPITLIWWRAELVETIKWAGSPYESKSVGSNGHNLSPRTSFEEWKETVRGSSRAWDHTDRFAARELKAILQTAALDQMRVLEQERSALLAIMGHDLRDPLAAIDLAVTLMKRGLVSSDDGAKRIEYSSRRMQSLVAYILDLSRLRAGVGLAMAIQRKPLEPILRAMLEQNQQSHPGVEMHIALLELGVADVDEDRLVQAVSNLLSNARHHGDMRFPISVRAYRDGNRLCVEITNRLLPGKHFKPGPMTSEFKASSTANPRNKAGLGLGLFITNAIAIGHGGSLESRKVGHDAQFTIVLKGVDDEETAHLKISEFNS